MSKKITLNVTAWLSEPMPPEVQRAIERIAKAEDVVRVAVMPDVHLAHDVCIGTVLATTRLIYPAAVGGDIGCGIAALAFDVPANALRNLNRAQKMFDLLHEAVPLIRHRRQGQQALAAEFESLPLSDERLNSIHRRDGVVQFGTLGRGNHFLEFQADEEDRLWLMVHSGSRAMGQAIRDLHVSRAVGRSAGVPFIDSATSDGAAYLADAAWARRYAKANRRAMIEAGARVVRGLVGAGLDEASYFDCDHNHVLRETHFGRELWVHRKGAISAELGAPGIIPGSMGTESFHVEGRGNAESLCSSSHGAGRAMSRDEARRRVTVNALERQMNGVVFDPRAALALREEAPAAYKDIRKVFRAQTELTRIVRRLRPVLCYKG
jgi:tRNA-splicing ligase RtcB